MTWEILINFKLFLSSDDWFKARLLYQKIRLRKLIQSKPKAKRRIYVTVIMMIVRAILIIDFVVGLIKYKNAG